MICVQCLAELNKPTEKPRKGNLLRTVTRGAFFVLAVLTSWLFFIFLGKALIWFKGGSEWLETL